MPRQAVRVVLGRSAKAASTPRLRPFSTTPKRRDDDASKPPTRRDRSVAAASAIGALSRPSQPSQRPEGSSPAPQRKTLITREPSATPHSAALGARLGANVVSVRSLPKRREGNDSGPAVFRRLNFRKDGSGGPQGSQRPQAGQPGASVVRGGFTPGPNGPRFARPPAFRGQQAGGPGSRFGAAGGKRPPFKRGGGGARKKRDDEKKKEREQAKATGMKGLSEETQAYAREQEVGGPEVVYTPSVTLESLVGWGPAVATNTALGQADMAARSIKTLGGGRGTDEGEQSFKIADVKKRLSANKPVYFASIEQKRALIETLAPARAEKMLKAFMQARVDQCRLSSGENWGASVASLKAWATEYASSEEGKEMVDVGLIESGATPEKWLKLVSAFNAVSWMDGEAARFKTQNSEKTKEAVHKFVLKGEHPEVKYAEDVYSKLATYHAQGSTYTIADGAKFDEKIRKLIKVAPPVRQAAPKAAAP
ncbi:hypothetical protein KVR01_010392 [Diaporthe batatas]|uniref:uncharacterized protein n=1 Tax=Diaporthe batatas TaxID=748121 RepID=UPI001D04C830|nr:uncharacterized protein KVR01_010392 [Diaporthe batatas]KAG8159755.1 hypothetical protein KVR01_010392 [Diaporthe batatas]